MLALVALPLAGLGVLGTAEELRAFQRMLGVVEAEMEAKGAVGRAQLLGTAAWTAAAPTMLEIGSALAPLTLGKLSGGPVALGPLWVALGRGEREALTHAMDESLARARAVPVPVLGCERKEAGEGKAGAVVVMAVAQVVALLLGWLGLPLAVGLLLGWPGLLLAVGLAQALALLAVLLLCEKVVVPLPLWLPEIEAVAEGGRETRAGAVAAALALASSGEDVAVEEADTLALTLAPAVAETRTEALGRGETVRDAAPLPFALLLELGVTL